jgi:hypothetical protein
MSTDLYGVRILDINEDEKKVKLRVFVVYYDTEYKYHQPIPTDKSFFLRILWDEDSSIGKEITVDNYLDETWVNHNTYKFVEKLEILSDKNYPIEDYSGYFDFYYERGSDDPNITASWQDEDKLVQCDYNLYVTDKKYLDHLSVGLSWGTTAYETNAIEIDNNYAKFLPNITKPIIRLTPFKGEAEDGTLEDIKFSKDSKKLIISSQDGEVVAISIPEFKELWRNKINESFTILNMKNSENYVWGIPQDSNKKVWDLDTGKLVDAVIPDDNYKYISKDEKYYIEYGEDECLYFFDNEGNELFKVEENDTVEAVSFTNDDNIVAIAGMFNYVSIFDIKNKKEIQRIEVGNRVNYIDFSPNGELLAVSTMDYLKIYNIKDNRLVFNFKGDRSVYLCSFKFSPDNKYFAQVNIYSNMGYEGYLEIFEIGI